MAYDTLMTTTAISPIQKKSYKPYKMVERVFKAACKMFKDSSHQTLTEKSNPSFSCIEQYQNWQNEQLEQSVINQM
ncbi:uncharacterized protein Brd [Drosophila tropicalis]|uniref:uncharacterized protein Brd n=1 Tax=Drosophila tropicalis TaxID=46794 RepID=UPI0035ABC88F